MKSEVSGLVASSSFIAEIPSYGVDAPGVVRGFLAGGAALAIAIAIASGLLLGEGGGQLRLAGWLLLVAAAALLTLGLSMLLYAFTGERRLRDHLLRQRARRGDEVILDVGAGRGLMAVGAAQRVPIDRVIAINLWSAKDLTGNTPDALRSNARIERVETRIDVVTGDARKLDLADASIDAVVSVFCLHNIEPEADRHAACREIARVLKVGGTAMIADFPGASSYVGLFRASGLEVAGPFRAEPIALGIAGYLIATKRTHV